MDPAGGARAEGLEFRVTEAQRQADEEQIADQQETFQEKEGQGQPGQWFFQFLVGLPREVYSPVRAHPIATYSLIAACVLVFVVELTSAMLPVNEQAFINHWGLVPSAFIRGHAPWTLLTSMFLHGGALHLAGNMYFLWVFGDNVEDRLGLTWYLALYLLGGAVAALAHIASDPVSTIPVVGASGAIAAVMGAYVYLFPDRRLYMMVFYSLKRIRAIWYLGFWLALQVVLASTGAPGVAWWAHIGGFGFGVGAAAFYRYSVARRIEALERSGG